MIDGLKPYPAMKDSGVPWLGEVPGHWEIKRGKAIFRCIDIRSSTGDEELLTVSSDRGVVPRSSATVTMFKAESYIGYKLCWPGDLVINSLWAWGRGLGVSRHHGIVSSAYGVYRLQRSYGDYASYIHELVRSAPFNWELQVRSKGIWVSRLQLTDEAFLGAPFPMPPTEEQAAIVRFLDHADRRIRRYIRAKQKLIKLLEEQKQALIHQAVTGRIDVRTGQSYPAYKNSGVEWLGEVPAHWEVQKLGALFRRRGSGTTPSGDRYYGGAIPWVMTGDLNDGLVDTTKRTVTDAAVQELSALRIYQPGALIVAMYGATIGKTGVLMMNACTNQACCVLAEPSEAVSVGFLQAVVKVAKPQLVEQSYGGGQPNINAEIVRALRVPVPPRSEQEAILRHIGNASIDSAMSRAAREISVLHEYRTRLIADVVTGKLDVREAAARLPDEGDELLPDAAEDESAPDEPADDLDALPEEAEA